ncbi:glutamate synthase-related protein [Streptomyces sp. NPDC052127]
MRCHTGTCPAGVATQDPLRTRSLNVADKAAPPPRGGRSPPRAAG